jgi:lincosamide nucleotidyltransferase A/C/D/E
MDDVFWFVALMESHGVDVWPDGGWAVDACLGEQTRSDSDLDIAIEERDVQAAIASLSGCGWVPVPREDTTPWCFHLGDAAGGEVDFHVIVIADDGRGIYGPPENGVFYSADALTGTGTLRGQSVRCITPEWLVAFKTGYEVGASDWSDVRALCERFGIPVPDDYRGFARPFPPPPSHSS